MTDTATFIARYKAKSFTPAAAPDAPHCAEITAWFLAASDKLVTLANLARTFEQETALHQFKTIIHPLLSLPPPDPLQYADYETPTLLAKSAILRQQKNKNKAAGISINSADLEFDPKSYPQPTYLEPFPESATGGDVDDVKFIEECYEGFLESTLVKELAVNLVAARKLIEELDTLDSWELVKDNAGTKTYYRQEKGKSTYSFKVVGTVDVEFMSLFTLIYENHLFNLWFPFMKACNLTHVESNYSKICSATIAGVWPWADRSLLLNCVGTDDSYRGRILIHTADVPTDSPHYQECDPKNVRCFMSEGGFLVKPFSRTQTEVCFYSNVDPQLSFPSSLMNMVTGKLIGSILSRMVHHSKKCLKPDSPWAISAKEHQEVYDDVQKALDSFFEDEITEEDQEENCPKEITDKTPE